MGGRGVVARKGTLAEHGVCDGTHREAMGDGYGGEEVVTEDLRTLAKPTMQHEEVGNGGKRWPEATVTVMTSSSWWYGSCSGNLGTPSKGRCAARCGSAVGGRGEIRGSGWWWRRGFGRELGK